MFSGGLDSIVATKLMLDLGVEMLALHFTTPFIDPYDAKGGPTKAAKRAAQLGVPLREIDVWPEFMELLKKPRYGFGKNLNPCIDCKIFFLRKAKQIMEAEGFDFVFTGEVKGQRPMSQNKQSLDNIANFSGLGDRLLRPLTAKTLPPTHPELTGLVDREKLLGVTGRSRKHQLALAEQAGIEDPPGSGGGCLLTDPNYSTRLTHLMEMKEEINHIDLHLLYVGRHLRLPGGSKVIVSRNESENKLLEKWAVAGTFFVFPSPEWLGPVALVMTPSNAPEAPLGLVAALMNRWGKPTAEGAVIAKYPAGNTERRVLPDPDFQEASIEAMHIRACG